MTRMIIVYNTHGDNERHVQSSATTWGELQSDLEVNGVSYRGMKAVIGETQNTLESNQAVVPEGPFSLFLMHQKVKSGSLINDEYIDEEYGISWTEVEWEMYEEHPEDYTFKTLEDLAMARMKKAEFYLKEAANVISSGKHKGATLNSDNSLKNSLREEARRIQANFGMFD